MFVCRTDRAQTRYTGALCGLGFYDPNAKNAKPISGKSEDVQTEHNPEDIEPLFPDHDVELVFDFKFDNDDLCLVISYLLGGIQILLLITLV